VVATVPGRGRRGGGAAREAGIHLRHVDADRVGVTTSEVTTDDHIADVWRAFGVDLAVDDVAESTHDALPSAALRRTEFMTHPVFSEHRSETQMLRYLKKLSDRDYALDRGMIPLGSCTMKLNATIEMEPVSWPEFANLHPYVPREDAAG
jgi:glycine dehydrogenase